MFVVIVTTSIPGHLHGYLSRFLMQVDTSVYVGNVSRRVRDNLWRRCAEALDSGQMTMVNNDPTREQGFAVNTLGANRRIINDYDGLLLPEVLLTDWAEDERSFE